MKVSKDMHAHLGNSVATGSAKDVSTEFKEALGHGACAGTLFGLAGSVVGACS